MALPTQCLRTLRTLSALLVILVTSVMQAIPADGATKGNYLVYIGTYTDHDSKGIYAYRFDSRPAS